MVSGHRQMQNGWHVCCEAIRCQNKVKRNTECGVQFRPQTSDKVLLCGTIDLQYYLDDLKINKWSQSEPSDVLALPSTRRG